MKFIPINEKDLINLNHNTGKLKNNYKEKRPFSLVKGTKQNKRLNRKLLQEGKLFQYGCTLHNNPHLEKLEMKKKKKNEIRRSS